MAKKVYRMLSGLAVIGDNKMSLARDRKFSFVVDGVQFNQDCFHIEGISEEIVQKITINAAYLMAVYENGNCIPSDKKAISKFKRRVTTIYNKSFKIRP